MEAGNVVPGGDQPSGTEQKVDYGIDFAAQCAKMFGMGSVAGEIEPLAMVGVHLGFAIAHLFSHVGKAKQAAPAVSAPQQQSSAVQPGQPG